MFRFQASLYMHNHINGLLPRTFFNFQLNSNIHSHFTRQSKNLHNIFSRTRCRQHSFQILSLKIWNTLPREIVNLPFARFRNKIKAYYFEYFLKLPFCFWSLSLYFVFLCVVVALAIEVHAYHVID